MYVSLWPLSTLLSLSVCVGVYGCVWECVCGSVCVGRRMRRLSTAVKALEEKKGEGGVCVCVCVCGVWGCVCGSVWVGRRMRRLSTAVKALEEKKGERGVCVCVCVCVCA